MNFWSRIVNDVRWNDLAWDKSGLLGATKKIEMKNKQFKIQILYNVMHYVNTGITKPLTMRIAYAF